MNQTYPKEEKLKGKYHIDTLFSKGKWHSCDSLRLKTIKAPEDSRFMIGVSVPKRQFKKAVDRNKIKRWLRELYRLNKAEFQEILGEKSHSMLFYTGSEFPKNLEELNANRLKLFEQIKKRKP